MNTLFAKLSTALLIIVVVRANATNARTVGVHTLNQVIDEASAGGRAVVLEPI